MRLKLTNEAYTIGKYVAGILLPASAAFYTGIAGLWNWPHVDQVVGTITLVDTLLGSLLLISTSQYNRDQKIEDQGLNP